MTMRAGKSKCPFIYPGARCKIDSAGIINNNVPGEIDFRNNAFLNFNSAYDVINADYDQREWIGKAEECHRVFSTVACTSGSRCLFGYNLREERRELYIAID